MDGRATSLAPPPSRGRTGPHHWSGILRARDGLHGPQESEFRLFPEGADVLNHGENDVGVNRVYERAVLDDGLPWGSAGLRVVVPGRRASIVWRRPTTGN